MILLLYLKWMPQSTGSVSKDGIRLSMMGFIHISPSKRPGDPFLPQQKLRLPTPIPLWEWRNPCDIWYTLPELTPCRRSPR